MTKRISALLVVGLLVGSASGEIMVSVDQGTAPWLGFMNVYNLPEPEGDGAFQFGSPWGVPDLVAIFDDPMNELALLPNSIGDPDPYWYQGGGGPGAPGNKIMEANLYQEVTDDAYAGQTIVFEGTILSNTYTEAHSAGIFIRDFAPDYSSFNETFVPADPGPFSISLETDPGLGRHVQWGFQSVGVNVWITDIDPFGSVVIETIPEPGSLALMGLGGLLLLRRRSA